MNPKHTLLNQPQLHKVQALIIHLSKVKMSAYKI